MAPGTVVWEEEDMGPGWEWGWAWVAWAPWEALLVSF